MSVSHNLQYYALISTAALMRILPRSWALFFGACIGQLAWWSRLKRDLVLRNVRQALPDLSEGERIKVAARSARNFCRTVIEFVRFDGRDRERLDELVEVDGEEAILRETGEGKGCLVLTAHLGAWALYFSALSLKGIPMSLLVGKQHNQKVDGFIHGISGRKVRLIPKGRAAVKQILQALAKGDCVVLVSDQHAGPNGIMSSFLGRETPTLSLPGAFVARNKIPVFTLGGYRVEGGKHRVEVKPLPIEMLEDKEALKQRVTDAYNEAIGEVILKHPDQYFWYHRRWRDSDADLASPGSKD